jgi:hypothetical protein
MRLQLIEDTKVLCKNDKQIIPASLWHRAVRWYHHYLQHPGHSCLEETIKIHGVLERYVQYYLVIRQILQILPNKQETQPELWSCTTKAGHNNSLVSAMYRPYRALQS